MTQPTVFIVDDEPGIRVSLPILLETAHLSSRCFASAEAFLAACSPDLAGCILLDVRMPGMNGPALQAELVRRGVRLPITFMTAHGDLSTGIEAMKQGAVDFLTKPVNGAHLLERVEAALELDRQQREAAQARRAFEARLQKLTAREREVLALAQSGLDNKAMSARLKVSVRTIESHRSRICLRTGVRSLAELAHQATLVGIKLV